MTARLRFASFLISCLLCYAASAIAQAQPKYEAEGGYPLVQRTLSNVGNSNGVSYAENITQVGSAVAFTVSVPAAGWYTVSARYAAAREYNWTMSVYVNGVDVTQAQFATTASWASWQTQAVVVALQAGSNTIKYQYDADDSGWINLDYIVVNSATSSGYTAGSAVAGALPAEIGIDKFTGTASFNVPLYTLAIPGFSLPVSLFYSATGVQTEDTGGEVGLNWTLEGGLGIHRQVRDIPDDVRFVDPGTPERRYGWLRYPSGSPANRIDLVPTPSATFNPTSCTANEQNALTQLLGFGSLNHVTGNTYDLYDTEPDVFTYSVPGYSGKFVFDGTGAVRLMPYAPVQISPLFTSQTQPTACVYPVPAGELTGFTIRTAEGIVYTFNVTERVSQRMQSTTQAAGTKYLLRDYYDFKINQASSGTPTNGPTELNYTTGWLVSEIRTPATAIKAGANRITFDYDCTTFTPSPATTEYPFQIGSSTTEPSSDHSLITVVKASPKLRRIATATAIVTFNRALDELDNFLVSSVVVASPSEVITSAAEQSHLIKSYEFKYQGKGRYLAQIVLNQSASTVPLYTFSYAATDAAGGALPESSQEGKGVNQDYWGFANNNRASTGIPQLYVYLQLLTASVPRPAAPYRLYPAPAYNAGGLVLPGADRRPANRLSTAVAGSLTGIVFATGGRVTLEYEQNQFYDPVAQQSLPAGGLRLRTVKVKDPVTQVETRRDYNYQQTVAGAGISSGVLLRRPRYAFAMPLTNTPRWEDITVRTVAELAADPFESRVVGYQQVTESVPGKGQEITTFAVPGGADETLSPGEVDNSRPASQLLPAWQRPIFGVARQLANGSCPNIAPLQAVGELYPFAPAPNYDFCRGLPLTVQYRAEPTNGTALGQLVRQETYTYQYVNVRPSLNPVTGLRYEQLGDLGQTVLAYAKYTLLTDYFYRPRQVVTTQFAPGGTASQSTTRYAYNGQGWLASKTLFGSDNVVARTRYKYLSDYSLPAAGATGELLTMSSRVGEGISADPVETISEIRPAGGSGHAVYVGATLQTFATTTAPDANGQPVTRTYPFELRRWQPAQPVASYDSVRVVNNALYLPATMRVAAAVLDVDGNLNALSVRTTAGRQVAGKHLGYGGLVPLLQVANAKASEVIFSDFETEDKPFSFVPATGPNASPPSWSPEAAHTGNQGCLLPAGSSQTTALPASTASQYRLVFWARGTAATNGSITVQPATSPAIAIAFACTTQWQRYEMLLPLGTLTNRSAYQLAITANAANSVAIQLDDVLLLPAEASAASKTYSLATGKTSETDARGRTTYYEYAPTGDLAVIRDHNQAIVHQYQKVLPSQTVRSGIFFTTSGAMQDQLPITFAAMANLSGTLQYKWDFGDGVLTTSSNSQTTHAYSTMGQSKLFTVKLTVNSQGSDYLYTQEISISPMPLRLTSCVGGVVSIDDCFKDYSQVNTNSGCAGNASSNTTTFQVTSNLGGVSYQWEFYDTSGTMPVWSPVTSNYIGGSPTSGAITVRVTNRSRYRCRVWDSVQFKTSEELSIMHYKSDLNCP